jgi:hypothetical protein
VPSRSVVAREAGRAVSYSFNATSYRVPAPGAKVDVARPTLVFTGESIIAGFGLAWNETIPAQAGALLGIQSVNLAVSDYSNDQSYLRLAAELPRFQKPVAVVTLFMPSLFDRNLLKNRPSLGPGLVWQPPEHVTRWPRCCTGSFPTGAWPLSTKVSCRPGTVWALWSTWHVHGAHSRSSSCLSSAMPRPRKKPCGAISWTKPACPMSGGTSIRHGTCPAMHI